MNYCKGNYTSGQNLFDLPEISLLCYQQEAEACDTRADSTLFYCSPLFGIHYSLFSREITPLRGTLLYHRSVYALWIYNYIYIAITKEQTVKCSLCPLPYVGMNEWLSDALMLLRTSTASLTQEIPVTWSKLPSVLKENVHKENFFKRLFCILSALFLSHLRCWHFLTLSLWLQSFSICVKFDKCPNRMCLNVILAQFFKLKDKMFYLTVGHTFQAFQL